jgi:hypothetical protein
MNTPQETLIITLEAIHQLLTDVRANAALEYRTNTGEAQLIRQLQKIWGHAKLDMFEYYKKFSETEAFNLFEDP